MVTNWQVKAPQRDGAATTPTACHSALRWGCPPGVTAVGDSRLRNLPGDECGCSARGRNQRIRHHDNWQAANSRNGNDILNEIEGELVVERRVDRVRGATKSSV